MEYLKKENYISIYPDPNMWRHHTNYNIMNDYKLYIKGKCADLGCNHGACTLLMLDFNPTSIHAYDINHESLKIGYNTAQSMKIDIPVSFVNADLRNIPIEDNYFDFIMSFHTLEHIYPDDINIVIKEIYRITNINGYVVISIPYEHNYPDPCHVAFYNEKTLSELFLNAGFTIIECFKDDRYEQKGLLTGLFQKKKIIEL